jgi:hypothetical protein
MFGSQNLLEKWGPVLNAEGTPEIKDAHKKAITAVVLENTEKALAEERQQSGFLAETAANETGNVSNWDPILISLVRRAMPNIIAYDIAGVQPMTGPTGLIFAMKAKMENAAEVSAADSGDGVLAAVTGTPEALHNVPETSFSGPYSTPKAEGLTAFREMSFTIDKTTVTAVSRALKAEYTMELAHDLKAVHGLDAESELANILSTEILAEINREVINLMNSSAQEVYTDDSGTSGVNERTNGFVIGTAGHGDGRWEVEHYKNLLMKIMFEANAIGINTRRGRGNFIVCSSNVASALSATGALEYAPALQNNLNVDDNGNLFAGTIHGNMKVFIDPFAASDYVTVGYKGTNAYDAGFFYCPYVPLTMVRAIGQDDFQPRIGFKTRYGMVTNPFTSIVADSNVYFRTFFVTSLV